MSDNDSKSKTPPTEAQPEAAAERSAAEESAAEESAAEESAAEESAAEESAAEESAAEPESHVSAAEAAEEAFFSEDAELYEGEEVDPELLKIPRRRRRRHPVISVAVILASLYLMWFTRADLLYFFEPAKPRELGHVAKALAAGKIQRNRFVQVKGPPDRKHALVLERRVRGYDTFYRLLGVNSRVFVQAHRKRRTTSREVDYEHFGRVVPFWKLNYSKTLAKYLERVLTRAHDIDFAELARAKSSSNTPVTIVDKHKRKAQVAADQPLWINAAYPSEWIVRLSRKAYKTIAEAKKQLEVINIPFAVDDEPSRIYWRLAVLLDDAQVKMLRTRFRTPELSASLVRRQVAYMAKWDQISVKGDTVVIRSADPSFPARYEKRGDKVATIKPKGEVRIDKSALRYITLGSKFIVPKDAVVLVSGDRPGDYWFYMVLYLVLAGFVVFNGLALHSRFKPDGKGSDKGKSSKKA